MNKIISYLAFFTFLILCTVIFKDDNIGLLTADSKDVVATLSTEENSAKKVQQSNEPQKEIDYSKLVAPDH